MVRFSRPVRFSSTAAYWPASPMRVRTRSACGHDVVARGRSPPGVGAQDGGEDAHRRGLAGPVGAEQAEDGALLDGEAHAVEGAHLPAEGLVQVVGLDGVGHVELPLSEPMAWKPFQSSIPSSDSDFTSPMSVRVHSSSASTRAVMYSNSTVNSRGTPCSAIIPPTVRRWARSTSSVWQRISRSSTAWEGDNTGRRDNPASNRRYSLPGTLMSSLSQSSSSADPAAVMPVDGALGALAFALGLLRLDEPVALQRLDHRVQRPEVELDALVLVAGPHGGGHLVGMHGPFLEAGQHGQRQGVGDLSAGHRGGPRRSVGPFISGSVYYGFGYQESSDGDTTRPPLPRFAATRFAASRGGSSR